jgi:hypothetical protein
MNKIVRRFFASALLITITASCAYAFPGSGGNCASCHSDTNGTFNFSPSNLLEIFPGQSGQITLNATAIPAGSDAAFGVDGLDAANLMATVGAGWTARSGGDWYTSSIFNTVPQAIALPVTLGANATPGNYTVGVQLAGTNGWSQSQSFTLRVLVPEPATIGIVGIALVSVGIIVRRRINRLTSLRLPS